MLKMKEDDVSLIEFSPEDRDELLNCEVTYAYVCRGPLRNYLEVRRFLKEIPNNLLVYSTKDVYNKLRVVRQNPLEVDPDE